MGFFDFLKGKKENVQTNSNTSNMILKRKENVGEILRRKEVAELTAEVFCCLDVSGSMYRRYMDGEVQRTLERIIPISLKFDDDGEIPVNIFSDRNNEIEENLNLNSMENYTENYIFDRIGGGTSYAPPIESILEKAKRGELKFPAFVIFITDGENNDEYETERALREASNYDIYFQFVGIGNERFSFLKKLDNLSGRQFDNAGFIEISEMDKVSDDRLYEELLREFIDIYKKNTFKTGNIKLIRK